MAAQHNTPSTTSESMTTTYGFTPENVKGAIEELVEYPRTTAMIVGLDQPTGYAAALYAPGMASSAIPSTQNSEIRGSR